MYRLYLTHNTLRLTLRRPTLTTGSLISAVDTTNLIGWWKFEFDGTDSHTNQLHLTEVGNPTYTTAKKGDGALLTPVSSQYYSFSADPNFNLTNTDFTFGFWAKFTSLSPQHLISINDTEYEFSLSSSSAFSVDIGGTPYTFTVPTLSVNQWYHIATGFDSTNFWVTVNDQSRVNQTATVTANYTNKTFYFGTSSGPFSDGLFDELFFYKRSLLQSEVINIYNGGTAYATTYGLDFQDEDNSVLIGII